MWHEEDTERMTAGLMRGFLSAAERAKLNKSTLTELVGVSRARFSTLEKDPNLSLHAFLRTYKSLVAIQKGLDEGWLPAATARGPGQEKAKAEILGNM